MSDSARFVANEGVSAQSAPVIARLISQIAARFGVVVSEKVAAQAAPILGAIGGATVNAAFADHFQTLARGHFIVRRLERKHGASLVAFEYQRLRGERRERAKSRVLGPRGTDCADGRWPAASAEATSRAGRPAFVLALARSAGGERARRRPT